LSTLRDGFGYDRRGLIVGQGLRPDLREVKPGLEAR
jgi:hypothetical protein